MNEQYLYLYIRIFLIMNYHFNLTQAMVYFVFNSFITAIWNKAANNTILKGIHNIHKAIITSNKGFATSNIVITPFHLASSIIT